MTAIGTRKLTHAKRRERRQQIAADSKRGMSLEAMVCKHGVGCATIRLACQEHAVSYPLGRLSARNKYTLRIIGGLLLGQSARTLAAKFRVSHQWIYQIRQAAIEAGIRLPKTQRSRKGKDANNGTDKSPAPTL